MANKGSKVEDKVYSTTHKIWRNINLFFKVDVDPVLTGMDCLDNRENISVGGKNVAGERDGEFMKYEVLYTKRNLDICKTYLNSGSFLLVEPDPGLEIKGE